MIGAVIAIVSRIRGIGHEVIIPCPMRSGAVRKISRNVQECRVRGAFGRRSEWSACPWRSRHQHDAAFGCRVQTREETEKEFIQFSIERSSWEGLDGDGKELIEKGVFQKGEKLDWATIVLLTMEYKPIVSTTVTSSVADTRSQHNSGRYRHSLVSPLFLSAYRIVFRKTNRPQHRQLAN